MSEQPPRAASTHFGQQAGSQQAGSQLGQPVGQPVGQQAGQQAGPQNFMLHLPGKSDENGWRKLHPLSPLLRSGITLLLLLGVVFANLRDHLLHFFMRQQKVTDYSVQGEIDPVDALEKVKFFSPWLIVGVVIVLIVLLSALFSWLSWRFYNWRVTGEAVEVRSGVVLRNHRRAPLDRVQSVNLQRPLLARIFALSKVEVQTAGQDGKVVLAYLSHHDAQQVRQQILHLVRDLKTPAAVAEVASPLATPGLTLPLEENAQGAALPAALPAAFPAALPAAFPPAELSANEILDAAPCAPPSAAPCPPPLAAPCPPPLAAPATQIVRVRLGRLLASSALSADVTMILLFAFVVLLVTSVMTFLTAGSGAHIGPMIFTAVAIPMFTLLLSLVSVLYRRINRGYNFSLTRIAGQLRISSGLSATFTESVPLRNIHAIEIAQPLTWRLPGWWQVRVTLAGDTAESLKKGQLQNVLLPVGTLADVLAVLRALEVPQLPPSEHLLELDESYLVADAKAAWLLWVARRYTGARVRAAANGAGANLWIRRGVLRRTLSIMPLTRAQSVQLSRPPLHYLLGLARLEAHTVYGPVQMRVGGLALTPAQHLFAELNRLVLLAQKSEQR